jgi:hypothetical protein
MKHGGPRCKAENSTESWQDRIMGKGSNHEWKQNGKPQPKPEIAAKERRVENRNQNTETTNGHE